MRVGGIGEQGVQLRIAAHAFVRVWNEGEGEGGGAGSELDRGGSEAGVFCFLTNSINGPKTTSIGSHETTLLLLLDQLDNLDSGAEDAQDNTNNQDNPSSDVLAAGELEPGRLGLDGLLLLRIAHGNEVQRRPHEDNQRTAEVTSDTEDRFQLRNGDGEHEGDHHVDEALANATSGGALALEEVRVDGAASREAEDRVREHDHESITHTDDRLEPHVGVLQGIKNGTRNLVTERHVAAHADEEVAQRADHVGGDGGSAVLLHLARELGLAGRVSELRRGLVGAHVRAEAQHEHGERGGQTTELIGPQEKLALLRMRGRGGQLRWC